MPPETKAWARYLGVHLQFVEEKEETQERILLSILAMFAFGVGRS